VREDIAAGCDLVVLNKCSKLEAAGGGLRDAFAHTDTGKALVFQRGGASQRPRVAPAGYANARFAIAQNAQDSNRSVDAAGNLVNVG
jgi:hypothetical protein